MTAISWLCRRNVGFALAADGKAGSVAETPEEENNLPPDKNNVQKIFVTKFKGRDIAYAFTGSIFNKEGTFSLIDESKTALSIIAKSNAQSIYEYVDGFSRRMKAAYEAAKRDGRIKRYVGNPHCPDLSEANVVARVLFAGYFRKHEPSFAIVTLRHDDQVLRDPERRFETPPEQDYFVGAPEIAARFCGKEDHWVKKYARDVPLNGSLHDLASLAEGFIQACCDPRAEAVDPSCKAIGPSVHVAELTPSGFKWRIVPKENSSGSGSA